MIGLGLLCEVTAEITAQMLMHREVMSCMLVTWPIQVIDVLDLVLWTSITSIPNLLQRFRSFWSSILIRQRFLCGRKAKGLMEFALL